MLSLMLIGRKDLSVDFLFCASLFFFVANCYAQIRLDGSLSSPQLLTGSEIEIHADYGKQEGANLFYSFDQFSIQSGQTVSFTDQYAKCPVERLITRVTGGQPSTINGMLQVTIPEADFYLINPAGVVFGANAAIDTSGSFHVSTANYIGLSDNGRFDTDLESEPLLTAAAPESFGFLGNNQPQGVHFQDSQLILDNEQQFIVSAGEISTSEYNRIIVKKGEVFLMSVASEGEIISHSETFKLDSFSKLGSIDLGVAPSVLSRSLPGYIRAKKIVIRSGRLQVNENMASGNSENLDENMVGIDILSREGIQLDDAKIIVSGKGLALNLRTSNLELINGAEIRNQSESSSILKNISLIQTDNLYLVGNDYSPKFSTITTIGNTDILIRADHINLDSKASIIVEGGNLHVEGAKYVRLNGSVSTFKTEISATANAGRNGNLLIEAERVEILGGARISATFNWFANLEQQAKMGELIIHADEITVAGEGGRFQSSIQVETQRSDGIAFENQGRLEINTNKLLIKDKGNVSTRTIGAGDGGILDINADTIRLTNQGRITSGSEPRVTNDNAGDAGNIMIDAENSLIIEDNSEITVETEGSEAGDIVINADLLQVQQQSRITTSVAGGEGNGGNISINPKLMILSQDSDVVANAQQRDAGNITINIQPGGALIQSQDSLIQAASESGLGIDGQIEILAPEVDITQGFKPLQGEFVDVAKVIQKPCAQRYQAKAIQFTNQRFQVLPDSPYALRSLSYPSDSMFSDENANQALPLWQDTEINASLSDCH